MPRQTAGTAKVDLSSLSRLGLRKHFDAVARRAAKRILTQYPRTLAIGLDGSAGRGQPMPYSDVDIFAIMPPGRRPAPISYFDSGCYIGISFIPKKDPSQKGIYFFWNRGGLLSTRILYDPKSILKRRIRSRRDTRPASRLVESVLWDAYSNIIEYAGKLRNGWHTRNEYLTRYAARIIGERSQEAVMALNGILPISENVIWHQVMKARKKPPHFTADYPIALGLKGTDRTRTVFLSALRLARESLRLIKKERGETVTQGNFRTLLDQPLEAHGL